MPFHKESAADRLLRELRERDKLLRDAASFGSSTAADRAIDVVRKSERYFREAASGGVISRAVEQASAGSITSAADLALRELEKRDRLFKDGLTGANFRSAVEKAVASSSLPVKSAREEAATEIPRERLFRREIVSGRIGGRNAIGVRFDPQRDMVSGRIQSPLRDPEKVERGNFGRLMDGRDKSAAAPSAHAIAGIADIGPLIRKARKAMKLNQADFAAHAGVGRRFLSELEGGKPSLEFDKVLACAAAAGIDLFARPRHS